MHPSTTHSPAIKLVLPSIELPDPGKEMFDSDEALKEWVWKTYSNEIFAALQVEFSTAKEEEETMSTVSSTEGVSTNFHDSFSDLGEGSSSVRAKVIELLEQEVSERTQQLQIANAKLAEANRIVMKESQRQLQHFSMSSHEIRTPLNGTLKIYNR